MNKLVSFCVNELVKKVSDLFNKSYTIIYELFYWNNEEIPVILRKARHELVNKQVAGADFGGPLMSLKIHAGRKIV